MQVVRLILRAGNKVADATIGPFVGNTGFTADEFARLLGRSCQDMLSARGIESDISASETGGFPDMSHVSPSCFMDFLSRFVKECEKEGLIPMV